MAASSSPGQQQQHHSQQHSLPVHHNPHSQGLPSISSLTNGLPPSSHITSPDLAGHPETARDSGTWPGSQTSKHNSANSGLQVHTLLNPDDSPSRSSVPSTPLSTRGPTSAQQPAGALLPSINQGFHDPARDRDSRDSAALSLESRRSSVDSRMHVGMNNLYIHNPGSPYESTNNSQVSLAANLRRPNGQTPISTFGSRNGIVRSQPRIAPPITGRIPGAPDPTAANPVPGFAWGFPDKIPEEREGSDSDGSDTGMSRQNSLVANSVRSSIFSNDSHLPPGQRRLDDDHHTTHHHSMQHSSIRNLQAEVAGQGVGNYSRTPELRVSHKLAERKRRSEMKDLFEELNKAVPSTGGTKASKWEILTKAIEYIRQSQINDRQLHGEVQRLQRESDYVRDAHKENDMLRTEVQVMHQHLRRLDPNAPHVYGHYTSQLNQQPHVHSNGGPGGIALPPLQPGAGPGAHGPPPHGGAMQGVEFSGYAR